MVLDGVARFFIYNIIAAGASACGVNSSLRERGSLFGILTSAIMNWQEFMIIKEQ